jgi:tetrahydromethanopterin S-methyltransferase subunit D
MKLLFGLMGAALMIAFLASFVLKVREPALVTVVMIGVAMMLVDLWQARNERDS